MSKPTCIWVDEQVFHEDVEYIESRWQQKAVGTAELPLIDIGRGAPVVFVPVLEHLEFIYARQMRALSQRRRVILYRRQEMRTREFGLSDRVEELGQILDGLGLECPDLIAHGDAAMVLLAFAARYPERCRSLTIIAQGADYQIDPHPLIWLLQELCLRLPVEYVIPSAILRDIVINHIMHHAKDNRSVPALPRRLLEEQFNKIMQWPFVYKYSVLPMVHNFNIKKDLATLTMPVLLINRADDALAPEASTHWLACHLPNCVGYHVVAGRERFFMYARAAMVTPLIETFLATSEGRYASLKQLQP